MPVATGSLEDFTEDESLQEEFSESSGYKQVVLQQSVTMLAYIDRTTPNYSLPAEIPEPRMLLGLSIHDLPVVIGATVGATGLIAIILTAVIICHCCRLKNRKDKAYCLDNSISDDVSTKQGNGSIVHSDSVVFLGSKSSQITTQTIAVKTDVYQPALTRSQSVPLNETVEPLTVPQKIGKQLPKKRPLSQPVQVAGPFPHKSTSFSPKYTQSVQPYPYHHFVDKAENSMPLGLPSIPEVVFRSSDALQDIPSLGFCASCNALDEPCIYRSLYSTLDCNSTMKTRSLPLWGRTRPRPLSTEDDRNELYAKVRKGIIYIKNLHSGNRAYSLNIF